MARKPPNPEGQVHSITAPETQLLCGFLDSRVSVTDHPFGSMIDPTRLWGFRGFRAPPFAAPSPAPHIPRVNTFLLALLTGLGYAAWSIGGWAHRLAARSPALRSLFLWGGLLAIPLGLVVALVLPEQLKFNRESPAGIFYVYLPCFLVGGALFAGGIGAAVGAFRVRGEP